MKTKSSLALAALLLCTALPHAASAAPEASSFPRVPVLVGPGGSFPPVDYVKRGTPTDIKGCLRNGSWCEVSLNDQNGVMESGWVEKKDVVSLSGGREGEMIVHGRMGDVPVVTYDALPYRRLSQSDRAAIETGEAPARKSYFWQSSSSD